MRQARCRAISAARTGACAAIPDARCPTSSARMSWDTSDGQATLESVDVSYVLGADVVGYIDAFQRCLAVRACDCRRARQRRQGLDMIQRNAAPQTRQR